MISLSYDLHLHSCLSPCGDDDMTPSNIVAMAALKELDVIALTDHNTCKNCPAFMEMAKNYNIIAIPGMELCTAEEVHVVCLFKTIDKAMEFDQHIYNNLIEFPNNETIFGKQQIYNAEDILIGKEPNLLINATNIPFHIVYDLVCKYDGIMIPAHLDKNSNSLISNLGFVPPDSRFTCVELVDMSNLHALRESNSYLEVCNIITNSDAHYLQDINESVNYLYAKSRQVEDIFNALSN